MTAEPLDQEPDDALMAGIAAGNTHAFTTLFRRRRNDVYRVALLITGRTAVAEDIAQYVFLAVMREAHRYEAGRSTVAAWLCGIARNHARRRLDQDGRIVPLVGGDEPGPEEPAVHPDPLSDIARAQHVEALRGA